MERGVRRTSQNNGIEGFKGNIIALWYREVEGEHHSILVSRGLRRTSEQCGIEGYKENIIALWYRELQGEHRSTMVLKRFKENITAL